jgi:hypothetical protein
MIGIDLKVGELEIDQNYFSPKTDIDFISKSAFSSKVELWTSNDNWKSYRILKDEMILILTFKDKFLKNIEIYPIENDKKSTLNHIIEKLGGEHKYLWGEIEINDDKKAGYKSVIIKYSSL